MFGDSAKIKEAFIVHSMSSYYRKIKTIKEKTGLTVGMVETFPKQRTYIGRWEYQGKGITRWVSYYTVEYQKTKIIWQ